MKRIAKSHILIVGMRGLGAEIGKFGPAHGTQVANIDSDILTISEERVSSWCQAGHHLRP